jgi:hypothetical protein
MPMELRHLRYFVAVAEEEDVSRGGGETRPLAAFHYAAPAIALCLSALLLHERLALLKLVSGGIALAGVALMIDRKWLDKRQRPTVAGEAG